MTPEGARAWIAVIVVIFRDLLIPGLGCYLTFAGYTDGSLEPWHLPLLAGMMMTPLVGRAPLHAPPAPDRREELPDAGKAEG